MPDHVLTLIENPVNWVHSDESDLITISDFDASIVQKATLGTGVFYFYDEGWNSELSFLDTTTAKIKPGWRQINVTIDRLARFPCTGVITSSLEGYLIAPTVKIEVAEGSNIAITLLSPRVVPHRVATEKPALSIPDVANVTISIEDGALQLNGYVSSQKLETVRLVINRNPHLPVYREGYNEELCSLTGPGEINAIWRPVTRMFEECLLVFYPSTVGGDDLEDVAHVLGAPEDLGAAPAATIVGDGPFTDYKLRLTTNRRFRRSLSDETNLAVT